MGCGRKYVEDEGERGWNGGRDGTTQAWDRNVKDGIKGGKSCRSTKLTMTGKLSLTHHNESKTRTRQHDASSKGSSLYVNGLMN